MSEALFECVPNFSEGRDAALIRLFADTAAREGATVLDCEADASHNRCVLTFAGSPDAVARAAFETAKLAVARIDLNHHKGEHPRMGAVDVIPFVPVANCTIEDAIALSRDVAARIGKELALPVYLYAESAARPTRRALPDIRKGEFEGLRARIGADPEATPDFGPNTIHKTAGCAAVGARYFLIAYNIQLDTPDLEPAQRIAKAIRERDGGLPRVQAKGFEVEAGGRKLAQVSMNLLDYRKTSIARVYDEVEMLAKRENINIVDSELVGLVPAASLDDATARRTKLRGYVRSKMILEDVIAAKRPTM
ncbi:MAG: glutamate formimidoyltransferase [Planctomycetes bacterium]|nr:glutamate formimidoyltransferase [Planctomycetota bacterium]